MDRDPTIVEYDEGMNSTSVCRVVTAARAVESSATAAIYESGISCELYYRLRADLYHRAEMLLDGEQRWWGSLPLNEPDHRAKPLTPEWRKRLRQERKERRE